MLTWTGNLIAGQTVTITYTVTVNNPDNGDKTLITIAASTDAGSSCPPGSGNTGCSLIIPVLTPALTITKTANVATASPGQQVTYTVTVTDSGQTPYSGAAFTDNLSGVLGDASYSNDAGATAGSVSYANPVLAWAGDLVSGQTATITYTVTVNSPASGDQTLTNTVTSATAGSNCASGSTDSRCTTTINVAVLTIVNTANVSSATPGSTVAYTITITDTGQTSYDGATVTDPLARITDDATYNADATATAGAVTYTERQPDLDRGPGPRPGRRHHLHRHGEQPRHRRQEPHQYPDLYRRRQHLPPQRPRRRLHVHGHRPDPGPDHHQDRLGEHHHARLGGELHDHCH